MRFIELKLTLKLKKNIMYKNLYVELSNGFNNYFTLNNKLMKFHKENKFKFYSYSLLTPIENDRLYKRNKCYDLTIRFMDFDILNDFYKSLLLKGNSIFNIEQININTRKLSKEDSITKLVTITPAIITINNKNLDAKNMDLDLVKDKITANLNNKYRTLFKLDKTKPNHELLHDVSLLHSYSQVFRYKSGYLIGNKYEMTIKQDILSQRIAFMALATGVLEKNSLSFGYCNSI